jgi:ribosome biogenesis GTPase
LPHRSFDRSGVAGLLDDYGWTPRVAEQFGGLDGGGTPARVVRTDRGAALVVTPDEFVQVELPPGFETAPVPGDWLLVEGDPARPTLVAPRGNVLLRRDRSGSQALATNTDEVFVVCALDRPLLVGQVDRALVMAHESEATPRLVLTKADLCPDAERVADQAAALLPGLDVVAVSSLDGSGVAELRGRLAAGRTVALLGESGVGKSSLVNALAGRDVQGTAAVRERDGVGRHTTRARHLVPVGGGAVLIDTPGLRTFGVVGLRAGLARAFADVERFAEGCRFGDCRHRSEPACAVTEAVRDGALTAERLQRYQGLADATRPDPDHGRRPRTGR